MSDDDGHDETVVPIDAARKRARRNVVAGKIRPKRGAIDPPVFAMPDPDDWPIQILGRWGDGFFLIDATGMFRFARWRDLDSRGVVYGWFGPACPWLEDHFAKRELVNERWHIQPGTLRESLFKQAIARLVHGTGIFDPAKQARGIGAWRHQGNRLAINLGDSVQLITVNGHVDTRPPLALDRRAYIRGQPLPALADDEPTLDLAGWLAGIFGAWCWQYQQLAPCLVAGAIAAVPVAPVLPMVPQLAIAGIAGRAALLQALQRVLGGWLTTAREPTEQAIRYRLGYDQLAVLIDPDRHVAGREPRRKRPDFESAPVWSAPRQSVLIAPREAMAAFGAVDDVNTVTLRLEPATRRDWPIGDSDGLLAIAFGRMARRWGWLTHEVIPACRALLAEIDGAETDAADLIGTLLGCYWALHPGNALPVAADIDAFGDDLDVLMMAEHGDRVPVHVRALALLLDTPLPGERRTVRQLLRVAAGYRGTVVPQQLPIAMPEEWQAIRDAAQSDDAVQARALLGPMGLRVIGDRPGYRVVAIAGGMVPARDFAEGRPRFPEEARGDGFAEVMLAFPGAVRSNGGIRFQDYGRHRAVLVSLYPLIEPDTGDED